MSPPPPRRAISSRPGGVAAPQPVNGVQQALGDAVLLSVVCLVQVARLPSGVQRCGGFIDQVGGIWRVDGILATSRAFGDREFKDLRHDWQDHKVRCCAGFDRNKFWLNLTSYVTSTKVTGHFRG